MSQAAEKPRTHKRAKLLFRVLVPIASVLAVVCAGAWITYTFGGVGGEELCPQTFERRSFFYREIPLLGVQVQKVIRKDSTGKTEDFLRTEKHIPLKATGKQSWHIVHGTRGAKSWEGDAQILVNYFDARDSDGNPIWLDWSSTHPKLAAVLWPAVSRLAVEELYIYVPELIEIAKQTTDAAQFTTDINRTVAHTFFEAAERCQQVENHTAAIHYFDLAIAAAPNNAEYLKARAKSHEAAGNADKAKHDWAAAAKARSASEGKPAPTANNR